MQRETPITFVYSLITSQLLYVVPHGNSKTCKPFHPTWPSTMELIKKEGCGTGPKEVVARISGKVGGVMEACAPGQLPRGEAQVSNAKRHLRFRDDGSCSDELYDSTL